MLVLDSAGLQHLSVESFMALPKAVVIDGKKFKMGYITLHRIDHFTSLHYIRDHWFYYDGKVSSGKLVPAVTSNWDKRAPVHTVYFAA
jgi:hypothetical protein